MPTLCVEKNRNKRSKVGYFRIKLVPMRKGKGTKEWKIVPSKNRMTGRVKNKYNKSGTKSINGCNTIFSS